MLARITLNRTSFKSLFKAKIPFFVSVKNLCVVLEETCFIVNSIKRLFTFNINLQAIAVYNVGFVESNVSLCCF